MTPLDIAALWIASVLRSADEFAGQLAGVLAVAEGDHARHHGRLVATRPLDEARRGGRIKDGDNVLMIAFGGGLTWGASLVRW